MRRSRVFALVLVLLALSLPMLGAAASFSVSLDNGIDVPDRTVTIEDTTVTISSVSQFSQGDPLTVDTTAPSGESYSIYIYGLNDGSRQIIDTKSVSADSDGDVSFDTGTFDAGSYVVTIYHDGIHHDPQPFVIAGYDLSLSLSEESAEHGSTVDLSVTATATASTGSPASVELVLTDGDTVTRLSTTYRNGQYTTSHSLDYSPGDYRVYAVAHSPEDAPGGNKEIIALTTPTTLSITSQTTSTTTTTERTTSTTQPTTTSTTPASTTTTTTTTPTTPTTTMTTTMTSTMPASTTTTMLPSTMSTTSTVTTTEASTPTASTTSSSVIEPNESSTQPASGSAPSTAPWIVGFVLAVVALGTRLHGGRNE